MSEDGGTQGLAVATGCYFGVLPQVLMSPGHRAAVQVAQTLAGWFPRVYVELQNHGIDQSRGPQDGPDVTDDELGRACGTSPSRPGCRWWSPGTATTSTRRTAGCTTA